MSDEPTATVTEETPKAKRDVITLPPPGINPNTFARVMAKHLSPRVKEAGSPQDIGKRYFRPYLRGTFGATHEPHAPWTLTRPMMLGLLERYGNEKAQAYARNAKGRKTK